MILSAQSIMRRRPIKPFCVGKLIHRGMSYGLSAAGYDIRVDQSFVMWPLRFTLASSVEEFDMPDDLLGIVCDKSTWARRGITVQNTVIEPGWRGFLTIELCNHSWGFRRIRAGDPIAQILFLQLDEATIRPYGSGKYQAQPNRPVPARMEGA